MGVYENINGSQIPIASNLRFRNIPIEGFVTEEELVQGLATKNDVFQYETMPTASSSLEGKVVQYVGTTTANYTNGYFYKCVSDGAITPTYSWVEVISGGGGSGDMLTSVYDPNGDVAEAGGIPEYIEGEIAEVEFQVSEMPTPSVSNLGKVVQYIGASYGGVIKGHFYKCESNGATTPVYSWVDITNEHTILLHKHTAISDQYLSATHVWIPKNTPIPANSNAIVTILPRANKSFVFMLMRKNSETSYTIIEQFNGTGDANGTSVAYPVSKSTEDRYIGLYTSDAGIMYNAASGNTNRESIMKAAYSSFVDGTSNSFEQQPTNLDFSYELALEKSVRIGNVYYPVIVDGSGNGDFLTIADAVKATTDGDIIYICKGLYDESIDIRNHPRHFIGESKDNTFWVKSSDDYSLPPLQMTGGIVENLTIIAGYGLTPTYEAHRTPYAIHADSGDSVSHELIIRNCNLISNVSAAVGLGVRWNQKMTIQNCYLESNAEKTYSTGGGDYFQQGALYLHNDTNLRESTAFLSVENCEIKGVKNAVAISAINSGSTLTVRFLDNTMWSADNGTIDAVNIMQTPTGDHLAGSVIDLDAVSFDNNAEVLNAIVAVPTGGTTGQVLVKSSDADYDTEWGDGGNTKALETGMYLVAHRGLYGDGIPQNTIAAFINAFNDGFRWIEIDIRRTKDDVWVLTHDDVVTLYKNGISESVTISTKTYAELQDYTWDSEGQYKVDSFTKSLYELKKYNMTIIVDAKGETRTVDVCNIVADYGMQKHCYVSTTPTYIIAHSEELNKFKDISFRILVADYALGKQAISLIENPIILDINAGRWNDILPIALALRLPMICSDFTSTRIPDNRKAVINVVSGVMDMDNVTFDVLNAGTHIPVDYSEITIAEDGGVCASSEHTVTIHAQNDSDNGGYINLYTENPEIASLVQNTRGTNVNATITAVSDGVTVAKAINGSIVNSIPVNVSMNGFYGLLGDITDDTMKYTFIGNKISLFAGNGDSNMDYEIVKVRRFEYSDIGYYGKAFYIPEVPEGATKLHVSIDTAKANAAIYLKTYSAEKVKLQSYSWKSDREINLTSDEKYYAIGLRYNDARQLQADNHVSADFVTLLDAFSIEFT